MDSRSPVNVETTTSNGYRSREPSAWAGLAGALTGIALPVLAFSLAWHPFWRMDSTEVFFTWLLIAGSAILTSLVAAAIWGFRLVLRWWHVAVCVCIGATGGIVMFFGARAAMRLACMRGTGPQETWCRIQGYSYSPLFIRSVVAGAMVFCAVAIVGLALSARATSS